MKVYHPDAFDLVLGDVDGVSVARGRMSCAHKGTDLVQYFAELKKDKLNHKNVGLVQKVLQAESDKKPVKH
ncbi:MAG: hypothetical protein JW860_05325 [Sedimentisphaerales bacterium]|nr:hypothetical protein [Sedimentisphaerales bacterium]